MNPATVVPVAGPVAEGTEVIVVKKLELEDIDCCLTLKACALLSGDALCCIPCCCFCGGCCGRYNPCIINIDPSQSLKPGSERCQANCYIQSIAAMVMPCTFCGCLWGGCGLCTPCAKGVAQCTMGVESRANSKVVVAQPPPVQNVMTR
jgi:hypothetical protein